MDSLIELRKAWETGLEEKLFVVNTLYSLCDRIEVFVLLSGDDFKVHHYFTLEDDWRIDVESFPSMRLALQYISEEFKNEYPGFDLRKSEEEDG
jgi:hypothetical protein